MEIKRKRNSFLNIFSGLIMQGIFICINLTTQRVFVNLLGIEMQGLRGVFNNVISVLNLADLGLGSAIVFSMYRPLAINDNEKVAALLDFYGYIYRRIAICILLFGMLFLPFIPFFVSADINYLYAQIIFLLFVFRTLISYLFSYKINLFIADQKRYIHTNINTIFILIINLSMIIILKLTRNYIFFLIINVFLLFLQNLFISFLAERSYPQFRLLKKKKLDQETKKQIFSNTKALLYQRLGSTCVGTTDNLIIATVINLTTVGLYTNYTFISITIRDLVNQIFTSITAPMGNLIAQEDWESVKCWFWRIMFADFWLHGFTSICLFILLSPFVSIWMGADKVLEQVVVFILVLNFYLLGMTRCTRLIRDSAGLYTQFRLMPLVEGIVNLIVSIVLVQFLGLLGVLLGTLIGLLSASIWIHPLVVFEHVIKEPLKNYYRKYFLYFLVLIVVGFLTFQICSFIVIGNEYVRFIVKLFICVILPNILFVLFFWKDECFIYFRDLLMRTLKLLLKKCRKPHK